MGSSLPPQRRHAPTTSKRIHKIFETVQPEKRSELVRTRGEADLLRCFCSKPGVLRNGRAVGRESRRASVGQDSQSLVVFFLAAGSDFPRRNDRGSLDFNSPKSRVWSRALGNYA